MCVWDCGMEMLRSEIFGESSFSKVFFVLVIIIIIMMMMMRGTGIGDVLRIWRIGRTKVKF